MKYLQNESNFDLDQNLLEFGPTKKHNLDQSITICMFPIRSKFHTISTQLEITDCFFYINGSLFDPFSNSTTTRGLLATYLYLDHIFIV